MLAIALEANSTNLTETLPPVEPNNALIAALTATSWVFNSVLSMEPEKSMTNAVLKSFRISLVVPDSPIAADPSSLNTSALAMFAVAVAVSPSPSVDVAVSVIRFAADRVVDWSGPALGKCETARC